MADFRACKIMDHTGLLTAHSRGQVVNLNVHGMKAVSAEKGVWEWFNRMNTMIAIIQALVIAIPATITYFSGISRGETKQRAETQATIERLSVAVPETQRIRTAPVFDAMRAATASDGPALQSPTEVAKLAQNIANAVTGIPTAAFSVGTARVFEVPERKTALVCADRFHVGYAGPWVSNHGNSVVMVDEETWTPGPGETKKFRNGVTLTLMQVENKAATFDVGCSQQG